MGVINTTKSIYEKMTGQTPAPQQMPDQQEQRPIEDNPDDESSEGDPDREGNTDPGTNQPPAPDEDQGLLDFDPEQVRQHAMQQAASDINAQALAEAAANNAGPVDLVGLPDMKIQTFKYLSIGDTKGIFHVTGIQPNGTPFTVTEDTVANLTMDQIILYLGGIFAKFG